jgi:hypothetical protein
LAEKPAIVDAPVALPVKEPFNFFAPAMVWTPLVKIPPLVSSAGVKVNTPVVIVPP